MATFLMFGKYSPESLKDMSAERTEKVVGLIKKFGGETKAMYALLGKYDLVLTVDFSGIEQATKTSLVLYKSTGISFTTSPAVRVEEFDKMIAEV